MSGAARLGYDVVVVGARCAGAATALLLARSGLSVLAIDKAGYGSDTASTHALTRSAVRQLSRWGVLDDVRAAGTPRVTSVEYHYGDEPIVIPIRPAGDVDGLYAPRRTVLDRILVDAAAAGGATIAHRTRLVSIDRDPHGRVTGVGIADESGMRSVATRLVVGADGARSAVARLVDAPVSYVAPASSATLYGFVPGLRDDAYVNLLRPGVTAGVIPTNDGEANVWVSFPMARFAREARRDPRGCYLRILTEADAGLAAHVRSAWGGQLRSFPGLLGFVRQAWGPGWALVGDACYFKDPISAHGITDALIGAELVADGIVDIAAGRDEADALDEYSSRRTALAAPMIPAIEHLASYDWTLDSAQAAHIAVSRAMQAEWEALTASAASPALATR